MINRIVPLYEGRDASSKQSGGLFVAKAVSELASERHTKCDGVVVGDAITGNRCGRMTLAVACVGRAVIVAPRI